MFRFDVTICEFTFGIEITYDGAPRTMDHPGDDPEWRILDVTNDEDDSWTEGFSLEEAFEQALTLLGFDDDDFHAVVMDTYSEEYQNFLAEQIPFTTT